MSLTLVSSIQTEEIQYMYCITRNENENTDKYNNLDKFSLLYVPCMQ